MKAVKVVVFVLGIVVLCGSTANAQLINGGFESGLADWTVGAGGNVSAIAWDYARGWNPEPSAGWLPQQGALFASLWTDDGSDPVTSTLSQDFTVGLVGDRLSFAAFFDNGEWDAFFSDIAKAELLDSGGGVVHTFFEYDTATMFDATLMDVDVPWTAHSYVFTATGDYTLMFTASGDPLGGFESILGVDNVDYTVVPVPGAVLLGAIGLGFANWRLRRRKTS